MINKLTSSYLKRLCLIVSILCPVVSLAGGTADEESTAAKTLVNKIEVACHRFLDGKLAVNDLENLLSGSAKQAENKQYWSIRSDKYQVRASVKAETKNSPLEELELYPNDIHLVELKDLEKLFGQAHEFVRSRYTWVKFKSQKSKSGENVAIKAQLYYPPESKVSPVVALTLRRENNTEHR